MEGLKGIVLGFIAGAIAALTVGEFISWVFQNYWTGWDRIPWDYAPTENLGVPQFWSDTFWGGVWGAIFGLILGARPQGMLTFRGAILGLALTAVIGAFILMPLLTGRYGLFFDGDASRIIPVLFIMAAWGAVTAWLYGLFRYKHLPGFA